MAKTAGIPLARRDGLRAQILRVLQRAGHGAIAFLAAGSQRKRGVSEPSWRLLAGARRAAQARGWPLSCGLEAGSRDRLWMPAWMVTALGSSPRRGGQRDLCRSLLGGFAPWRGRRRDALESGAHACFVGAAWRAGSFARSSRGSSSKESKERGIWPWKGSSMQAWDDASGALPMPALELAAMIALRLLARKLSAAGERRIRLHAGSEAAMQWLRSGHAERLGASSLMLSISQAVEEAGAEVVMLRVEKAWRSQLAERSCDFGCEGWR